MHERGPVAALRSTAARRWSSTSRWWRVAAVVGLTGYALSWPVIDLLGQNPTFFSFRGLDQVQALSLVVLIALVPPLVVAVVVEATGWLRPAAGWCLLLASLGAMAALAVMGLLGEGLNPVSLGVGVVVGGLVVVLFNAFEAMRTFVAFSAVLPIVSLVLFVASPSMEFLAASPAEQGALSEGTELPNVVMIMLDEFPTKSLLDERGLLDAVRYPNLNELLDESTWYRHYTSQSAWTDYSVPGILTGRTPTDGAPVFTNYPNSLFTLLEPTHELHVYESYTRLCASSQCSDDTPAQDGGVVGAAQDAAQIWRDRFAGREASQAEFSEEIPFDDIGENAQLEARRPERHAAFLESLRPTDRPALWFEHLVLPHQPFQRYQDGAPYAALPEDEPVRTDLGPWHLTLLEHRHLLQAQYADELIGDIVDRLREIGEYDDTILVVTADHGARFTEGAPFRLYEPGSASEIAYAPLIIRYPGGTKVGIDDQNLMGMDLVPTIADILGLEPDWEVDGAPAGSAPITARGSTKTFEIFRRFTHTGHDTFDDATSFPDFDDRWVGTYSAEGRPLDALVRDLRCGALVGERADRATASPVTGDIERRDSFEKRDGEAPPAFVDGVVRGMSADAEVLVVVDGSIATCAPTGYAGEKGRFRAMLPRDLLGVAFEPTLMVLDADDDLRPVHLPD